MAPSCGSLKARPSAASYATSKWCASAAVRSTGGPPSSVPSAVSFSRDRRPGIHLDRGRSRASGVARQDRRNGGRARTEGCRTGLGGLMGAQLQEEGEGKVLVFDPVRMNPRRKWLIGAAGAAVVIAVGAAVWMSKASAPKAAATLASSTSIPLVSVVTPGVQPVATEVNFTGTIEARHALPIGNSGDTGRIVAVYVQVGDHVRRGQRLAQLDDSVLAPQVAQLSAALDQARAQAALSAAEYR